LLVIDEVVDAAVTVWGVAGDDVLASKLASPP
jgi:hypothetical protein